jgi:hypothetical protein
MLVTSAPTEVRRSMNSSKSISIVRPPGSTCRFDTRPTGDAAVAHRARDVETGDVLLRIGDELDDLAAPHPLDEEQRRREDHDDRDDENNPSARRSFLDRHGSSPPGRGWG